MKIIVQRLLNAITFLTITSSILLGMSATYNQRPDVYDLMWAVAITGHLFVILANYIFFGKLTLWHRFDEQA